MYIEVFARVDVCEGRESSSLVGDPTVVVDNGGDDKEVATVGGDEAVDAEFAAVLTPLVVREEADAVLEDGEALADDGDAVAAPKARAERVDNEDCPPDAFDFPLSVEWRKYKFSTSFRDCRCCTDYMINEH